MQAIGKFLKRSYQRPFKTRKTTDLKCPSCGRVVYARFYDSYHSAPWAALRSKVTCQCGYPMSL